jgi:hypothetical protein
MWWFPIAAATTEVVEVAVLLTEIQTATLLTTLGLTTAHVGEPSIYGCSALRLVTLCRDTVTDVPIPVGVKAE